MKTTVEIEPQAALLLGFAVFLRLENIQKKKKSGC